VKRLILSTASFYLFATILAQIASVIRIVALPYMLSPVELGLWSLFNMLIAYGANSHLGFLHGMNKLYPAMRARGEIAEAGALRDSVFMICGILGIAVSLLAGIVGLLRFPDQLTSVFFASLTIFFQSIHTFYFSLMRAENRFRSVGSIVAGTSLVSTGFILGSMFFNGQNITNAMAGLLVGQAISSLLVYMLCQTRLTPVMKRRELRMAFVAGFPLLVVGFIDMFFVTVDRWILSSYGDPTEFGFYSLAVMVCGVLTLFSGVVSSFTYTRMIEMNASKENAETGFKLFENSHDLLSLLLLLLIILLWQLVPFMVEHFAVRYVEAIPLLKVLTFGYYFLALAGACGSYAISCNKQNALLVRQAVAFALMSGLCFAAMKAGFRLVPFGATVSSVLFIFYVFYLNVAVSAKPRHWIVTLRKSLTSGLPLVAAWVIQYLFTGFALSRGSFWNAALNAGLEVMICWAGALLVYFPLNRRTTHELYQQFAQS
jgi:O-antigen/teichoic acid export membrane protein